MDVVVFRGIPPDQINAISKDIDVLNGSVKQWLTREDGALIGTNLAQRRRLSVGEVLMLRVLPIFRNYSFSGIFAG